VYIVYVSGTKDDNILKVVKAAIEKGGDAIKAASRGRRPLRGQKTLDPGHAF
jgi:hypothetical protein